MSEENPLVKLVERRHPEYEESHEHWEFLEDCYEGGREWFKENIFKYVKEGSAEFTERVERAYRFNHSREVVDLVNKYLFRTSINRNVKDAPQSVKDFWVNATRDGESMDVFSRRIGRMTSMLGRVYVVIDTNAPEKVMSVAEAKAAGVRTYAYIIKPQDALDMSFDDMGQLNWILVRERFRNDADPMNFEDTKCRWRYRLWTRSEWILLDEKVDETSKKKDVKIIARGNHNLGKVPVVMAEHLEDDNPYFTPALINDIAYLDRAVANYLSNLDAIIQDQTFSQLVLPAQGLMPGDEDKAREKLIEFGTKRIFTYNGEAGVEPKFISPDVKQAELIITAIKQLINEIYHTVGLAGERTKQDNAMGIDNSSGVAKAFDFDRVNALLQAKATNMDKVENEIAEIVALWNKDKLDRVGEERLVKYSDNFDVRGLRDEFDIANQLTLIAAPDEVRRKQMEALVSKLFPALSDAEREKLINGLSKWPINEMDMMNALGGGANPSGAQNPKQPSQGSNQAA